MRMAKASKKDLEMAAELVRAFESLSNRWAPVLPDGLQPQLSSEDDKTKIKTFDSDNDKQCGQALRHLIDIVNRGSLMKVVWGTLVLLDPANRCVDPNDDCIEHHPDAKAGLKAKDPQPLAEYHEDMGPVLWWRFPIEEPPYVGSPLYTDWPGAHTHFTTIIVPDEPLPQPASGEVEQ